MFSTIRLPIYLGLWLVCFFH